MKNNIMNLLPAPTRIRKYASCMGRESHVDMLAEKLCIDPVEIRAKKYLGTRGNLTLLER